MGTTTFYLKHNDLANSLNNMSKKEIKELSKVSPYSNDPNYRGWRVPMELHNGNVYLLVFWRGRLMKLEDAPKVLNQKYYNKYNGKRLKEYEWTVLKSRILDDIEYLDAEFKKELKKKKATETNGKKT